MPARTEHGTLTPIAEGWTYTPDADWSGSDQFTYYALDGVYGTTSNYPATVTVIPHGTVNTQEKPSLNPNKF